MREGVLVRWLVSHKVTGCLFSSEEQVRSLGTVVRKVADGKLSYSQEIVERYFHLSDLTLTPRELDVLYLAGEGMSNCEIADRLSISPVTIRNHLQISYLLGSERVPRWRARPYYVRSRARFETS